MPYTPPPAVVGARSLEDSYIALFKAGDPRALKLLPYVRVLVKAGKLTWDDVAKFLNDVVAVEDVGYDQIASAFNADPTVLIEEPIPHFTVDEVASILNSANFEVGKAASIINSANLTADRAASIFNHANLSVEKIASICEHANLEADKAASIFESANLAVSKVASIFDHTNLSVTKAASILNSANLTATRVEAIFSDPNLSNTRAKSIASELATNTAYTNYANIEAVFKGTRLLADDVQDILYGIEFGTRLVDLLTGTAGDLTVSSNTSITGVNRYGTLKVNSGVTLTVDGQPGVLIVKTLENGGSITKSLTGGAGGEPSPAGAGAGRGGNGGGGLLIFTGSLYNSGVIEANGEDGESGSTVAERVYDNNGEGGYFLRVGTDSPGKGGDAGWYSADVFYIAGHGRINGGGGGDGETSGAGGDGGDATLETFDSYADLAEHLRRAVIDWFIVNVLGKSPTTTIELPNIRGSGGGSGSGNDGLWASGGGGGGGGEIIGLCVELNNTGTIRCNGGNGGNGGAEGSYDGQGGGGGGGIVYVFYKTLISSGTLQANGGVAGTGDETAYDGEAGVATAVAI